MKTRSTLLLTRVFLSTLLLASALGAGAFQGDDKSAAVRPGEGRPPVAARQPSADQLVVAGLAAKSDVKVSWHARHGTPLSIRGAGLAERRAWSGGRGLALRGGGNHGADALAVLDNLARFYGVQDAAQEFTVQKTEGDKLGHHHVRLAQQHEGRRVVGGDLVVHFDQAGQPYQVNGDYVPAIPGGLVPRLTADEAARAAQQQLAAAAKLDGKLEAAPVLVIFARGTAPLLAYELTLTTRDPKTGPGRWRCWIGAERGEVLARYNDIKKIAPPTANGTNAVITGNILAGEGGQSISVTGRYENTGFFYLYNTNRHWYVYNVATSGYPDTNTYAHRATSAWGTSDRSEMSLGRNFDIVQRYFTEVLGRTSFDDAGIYAEVNAHEGINYVNAYWDGSAFYFGDGNGTQANSLAVLDICGHEFTHAVTEHTAGLVYAYESGALNESFSDIFGAAIEFYAQADGRGLYPAKSPGLADWLCGEDSWLSSTALRDLRNPANTATVGAGNEQPSRYLGTHWYDGPGDNGGVHQNSGVQNFLFYLLCEGGSGNNDGILYNVAGLGLSNAQQVAYRALSVYCTPDTDYEGAREAWISAALDLNPAWVAQVSAAWSAVGLGPLLITPETSVTFRGDPGGPFTPATQSFTLFNRGVAPMTWSVTHTQAWLNVSPVSGTIPAGASVEVALSVNAAANALPLGLFSDTLSFSNSLDTTVLRREARLLVGQQDFFTEWFQANDSDLGFQSLTFTPDGSASFYAACREVATNFPTDPAGGTFLSLSDDSYAAVSLSGSNTVGLYGRRRGVVFVGSNGYLTLDSGDSSLGESFSTHFSLPRVSACFDDLLPGSSRVSWKQTADRLAVTYNQVPEYGGSGNIVSFQIEMFFDGKIRITYLGMEVTDGLAGLSDGNDVPPDFVESDLTSYAACPPPDDLRVTPAAALVSTGYEGGPFTPASALYTLVNGGSNSLNWSATKTQPWLSLSASGGALPPSATNVVTVSLHAPAALLAPGVYTDTVTFSNTTSGYVQTRGVSLRVLAIPGEIAVRDSILPADDLAMAFGTVIQGAQRAETITITNSDPTYGLVLSDLSFGAYTEDFEDGLAQDWLSQNPAAWQVTGGEYRAQSGAEEFMVSLYQGETWADVTMSASFRRTGSPDTAACLVLRASPDFLVEAAGSGYVFQISEGGSYGVWKQVNGNFSWLRDWLFSSAIVPGSNRLTAVALGSALRFYINGILVWSGTDNALTSGRVGLMGYSSPEDTTAHFFDNVSAGEPQAGFTGLTVTSGPWRLENVPALPHTVPPHGSLTVNVVYQPAALGSNHAQVVIKSNDADEPRVDVQLTGVSIPDFLLATPASGLVSSGHPGGPFAPPSVSYFLSNAGPGALTWTSAHTQAWVSVVPPGGVLAGGASVSVTVGFNVAANALGEGLHRDLVIFSNVTTTVAQSRPVSLNVFTSPQMVVTPGSMSVTNVQGGQTNLGMNVSNANGADGNLTFHITTRETGRSNLAYAAAAGVGLPPAGRDFTKLAPNQEFAPERLLVRFAAGTQAGARAQIMQALGGAQILREYKTVPGLCLVKLPAGQALANALVAWNQTPGILYAEPDYRVRAIATTPNDPRYFELWGLHNTGQTGGTAGADIDAERAWDVSTGSRQIVVAVIDTGVDYNHPDLVNNIWTNAGEIPGNGLDDDSNGHVDDVHGFNFVGNNGNPMDDNEHGTHCAGTIGAEGNNGVGVAGVCWQVSIMAVKFLDAGGGGNTADAISSVEYATLMGAQVMNNSWGGGGYSQALKDAIDAAGAAGSVFVAAAGNSAVNNDLTPHYPSSYASANVVAVMSTDDQDARSSFSSFGLTSVDLAAPGSDILSCAPGGGYQLLSGTSMATPHVAGACALLLSVNPSLTVAALKEALFNTVEPTLAGQCVSGGRMNVARALARVGASWITVTPQGGTNVAPGGALNLNVNFQAGDLPPGTYTGQLVVTGNDVVQPVVFIPVRMVVVPDSLRITPTNLFVSAGYVGGPFVPVEMNYTLSNIGPAALNWAATVSEPWVSVNPSGPLASGAGTAVTVQLTPAALTLSNGLHTATVTFSNVTSGAVSTRGVELTVEALPLPPTTPINPRPTNHATVVSVHTQLSWNNGGAAAAAVPGAYGVIDTAGYDAESLAHIQGLPGLSASPLSWATINASSGLSLLNAYAVIYFSVNAGSVDYQNLRSAVAAGQPLEQFVSLGGTLVLNVAGNNGSQADLGPGGLDYDRSFTHEFATLLLPAHPYVTGQGYGGTALTAAMFNNWGNTDHGTLTGLPAGAVALLGNGQGASMIEYAWGTGRVMASTLTFGWFGEARFSGPPFDNELLYAASGLGGASAKYQVYLGTGPGAMSLIATNLAQPNCQPGLLAFNTAYYWQVVASNVVGSATGAVWSFTTALDEVRFASATTSRSETSGVATITVTRENPAVGVSIGYSATNGTATAGVDYLATAGTLVFPPGLMSTNFQVPILDDAVAEGSETVLLRLHLITPGVLLNVPSNAVLTILDNDGQFVSLPYIFFDGDSYRWDVYGNGSISDGTSDAYDGGLIWSLFPSVPNGILTGRELLLGPVINGAVEISRRIYVPTAHGYARFLEVVRNVSASPVTTGVAIYSNLGSDGGTVLVNTSSGDALFATNDHWIVTDDSDGTGDPTLLHVFGNTLGGLRPSSVLYTVGTLDYQWTFTLAPGETKSILHFASQNPNRATALAKGPQLAGFGLDALAGLDATDLARIVNFGWPAGPVLLTPVVVAGNVQLRFLTQPGQSYTVQSKNSLSEPSWQTLQTVTGHGGVMTVPVPFNAGTNCFYRLQLP